MDTEDEMRPNWSNGVMVVAGRHEMRVRAEGNGAAPVSPHGGRRLLHVSADGPFRTLGSAI